MQQSNAVRVSCDAILFDLDGVLVDSMPAIHRILSEWARERGLDKDEVIAAAHGRRTADMVQEVAPDLDADSEAGRLSALEAAESTTVEEIPGARRLLANLDDKLWAVVSSGTRDVAMTRMRVAGLPDPEFLITAEDVAASKPNPEGYLQAAELLGVDQSTCLVVEDSVSGVAAARAAGMRCIGRAEDPRSYNGAVDAVIKDLRQITVEPRAAVSVFVEETPDGSPGTKQQHVASSAVRPVRVALLGCGVVGSEVAHALATDSAELARRAGVELELAGVAVRRPDTERIASIDPALLTADSYALVTGGDVDVVVEAIGGTEPARSHILAAMERGASVVTTNKELLAEDGACLRAAAEKHGVELHYEASVAGAIPLLRCLRDSMAGDTVHRILGIVNGTANYVLSRMDDSGMDLSAALDEAGALGYTEADPGNDVEGFDAAAKAAILASLAFQTEVSVRDVYREGITAIDPATVARAQRSACVIKQLVTCERVDEGRAVTVATYPAMIPRAHPLASVGGARNAVFVDAERAGPLMLSGVGAGGVPTASAVLGDLVAVARNRQAGTSPTADMVNSELTVHPVGHLQTRHHVNVDLADQPGALADVAGLFADHGVSIATVRQEQHHGDVRLAIVTHPTSDSAMSATVAELHRLGAVRVADAMRVLDE